MFVRVFRKVGPDTREVLINVNTVWKIEVTFNEEKDGDLYRVRSSEKIEDPASVRLYKVFFGNDEFELPANPDSEAVKVFADIDKNAVR